MGSRLDSAMYAGLASALYALRRDLDLHTHTHTHTRVMQSHRRQNAHQRTGRRHFNISQRYALVCLINWRRTELSWYTTRLCLESRSVKSHWPVSIEALSHLLRYCISYRRVFLQITELDALWSVWQCSVWSLVLSTALDARLLSSFVHSSPRSAFLWQYEPVRRTGKSDDWITIFLLV